MRQLLLVGGGGLVGALARYLVVSWTQARFGAAFPYGTFVVNAGGSFLIGLIMTLGLESGLVGPDLRLLLVTGLLGGFTTFSALSYESFRLATLGSLWLAAGNVGLNVFVGLVAVTLGAGVARLF